MDTETFREDDVKTEHKGERRMRTEAEIGGTPL